MNDSVSDSKTNETINPVSEVKVEEEANSSPIKSQDEQPKTAEVEVVSHVEVAETQVASHEEVPQVVVT